MARVVADGADVDVERGADHLAVRVLQHVGRVHRLRLVVVLTHCYSVVIHSDNVQTSQYSIVAAQHCVTSDRREYLM